MMLSLLRATPRTAPAFASRAVRFSTAAEPLVLVEKVGNYAVVRMNRPPVNSLNTAVRTPLGLCGWVRYGRMCGRC